MNFINKQDDIRVTLSGVDNLHQPFLKHPSVLRPTDDGGQVDFDDLFIQKIWGDCAVLAGDSVGEPLYDSRLAHAWFADQNWVALGRLRENHQHLDHLAVTFEHVLKQTVPCLLRQVGPEAL